MESEFFDAGMLMINALTTAKKKIIAIPIDAEFPVRFRILNQLNAEINRIRFEQCGLEPIPFADPFDEIAGDTMPAVTGIGGPLTKIFGKEIKPTKEDEPNFPIIPIDPNEADIEKLSEKISSPK